MKDLKTIKALVLALLESDPKARNSDSYLYYRVIKIVADKHKIDLSKITVIGFLLNMKQYPFPPFESVRRTRQKIQVKHPELAASAEVQELRAENEEAFLEFART